MPASERTSMSDQLMPASERTSRSDQLMPASERTSKIRPVDAGVGERLSMI